MISCLCVTRDKPDMLARVIRCFRNQSYENKQLVILYEDFDLATDQFIKRREWEKRIKIIRVGASPVKCSLGELRNISVREADGEYVCQWDDDDWFDPDRLTNQMQHIQTTGKPACLLSRWIVYDAIHQKAYISNRRLWEGSILCQKLLMLEKPYPAVSKGEDSSVIEFLYQQQHLHIIEDMPELYIYISHGNNTWEQSHFDLIFTCSTALSDEVASDIQAILEDEYSNNEI